MNRQLTPVTADKSSFTFYDIEALANAFTLCAYTPPVVHGDGRRIAGALEVFYLVDDELDGTNLADLIDHRALGGEIFASNPGLPAFPETQVRFYDLRSLDSNVRLAQLVGLSDAESVSDPGARSGTPAQLRPVCDTDPDYDPMLHPFLAGYNSMNYDTVMLALYLLELRLHLARQRDQSTFERVTARSMRDHNDQLFSEKHIEFMPGYLGWDGQAAKIRRAMLQSGRHLDVARLNEAQFKVSLKRLLGMLGHQIKESEKLSHNTVIRTVEELYELLAYNVSDCLGLSQLFRHPAYASNFDLKASLLAQYSETVFDKRDRVRRDRLAIDASSAKFVGRILAPYDALNDIETVSFVYPHPEVARERGVEPVNVLEECLRFFRASVVPDLDAEDLVPTPESAAAHPAQAAALAQFAEVVRYYRSIEGKNFNDSDQYQEIHPYGTNQFEVLDPVTGEPHFEYEEFGHKPDDLRSIPKTPNNVPYFRADAKPSACFATFSTGGIHGAEADVTAFTMDRIAHVEARLMIWKAKYLYPEATAFVAEAARQHNLLSLPDGTTVDKRLVLLGSDPAKVKYRKPKKDDPEQTAQLARAQELVPDPAALLATQRPASEALNVVMPGLPGLDVDDNKVIEGKTVLSVTSAAKAAYRDVPAKPEPVLFKRAKKNDLIDCSTKLEPKYTRTSAGLVIHEDFTSYYPNLLRNMRAFYNPELGEDRYANIFFDKERYGREMKRPGISAEEKTRLNTLRNGTKLILNAASGAGDASHNTPIRMNNQIISMRILGQLFSWRIGQAQTLAGARIISTNTDGLYSVVGGENGFDEATNNRVLSEQQAEIGVDIEPELMFLISKDSNNRLELKAGSTEESVSGSAIISASGGTLACHAGPNPTKSLAHPAVVDFALACYLRSVASRGEEALAEPFDEGLGRSMIERAVDPADPVMTLMLFQNVLAASRGSITYPFAAEPLCSESENVDESGEEDGESTDDEDSSDLVGPRALQMVNRVFVVQAGTEEAVSLHSAGAWKVSPVSREKRRENGHTGVRSDKTAIEILRHHGWERNRRQADLQGLNHLPEDEDVVVRRINGIDPAWSLLVVNDDLRTLSPERAAQIISALDLDVYVRMLGETYSKNWQNTGPGSA